MSFFFIVLIFLLGLFVFQIFFGFSHHKIFYQGLKYMWVGAIFLVLGYYVYLTYTQYLLWSSGPPTIYFIPPYRSISYLLQYHAVRFLMYYCVSFLAAAGFFALAVWANKKHGERFFEKEEPYIGALAIFLLGHREWNYAWIYYFILLCSVYLLLHVGFTAYRFSRGKREPFRIPVYPLWTPLALICLVVFWIVV